MRAEGREHGAWRTEDGGRKTGDGGWRTQTGNRKKRQMREIL